MLKQLGAAAAAAGGGGETKVLLQNVSFSLDPGEVTYFMGPSGAGRYDH